METPGQPMVQQPAQGPALPPLGGSPSPMPAMAGMQPTPGTIPPMVASTPGESGVMQLKIPLNCLAFGFVLGLMLGFVSGSVSTPAQLAQQVGLPESTYYADNVGDVEIYTSAFGYDALERLFDRCGFDGDDIIAQVYSTSQRDGEQVRTSGNFSIIWKVVQGRLSYCWILKG